MNAYAINLLISVISNIMAANLSIEELEILAVLFTQLGDSLATIAAIKSIKSPTENNEEVIV